MRRAYWIAVTRIHSRGVSNYRYRQNAKTKKKRKRENRKKMERCEMGVFGAKIGIVRRNRRGAKRICMRYRRTIVNKYCNWSVVSTTRHACTHLYAFVHTGDKINFENARGYTAPELFRSNSSAVYFTMCFASFSFFFLINSFRLGKPISLRDI